MNLCAPRLTEFRPEISKFKMQKKNNFINLKIIINSSAHSLIMIKMPAIFQEDCYKTILGVMHCGFDSQYILICLLLNHTAREPRSCGLADSPKVFFDR